MASLGQEVSLWAPAPCIPTLGSHQPSRAHPTAAAEQVSGLGLRCFCLAPQHPPCAPKHSPAPRRCQGLGLSTSAPGREESTKPWTVRRCRSCFWKPLSRCSIFEGTEMNYQEMLVHADGCFAVVHSDLSSPWSKLPDCTGSVCPDQRPALPPIPTPHQNTSSLPSSAFASENGKVSALVFERQEHRKDAQTTAHQTPQHTQKLLPLTPKHTTELPAGTHSPAHKPLQEAQAQSWRDPARGSTLSPIADPKSSSQAAPP